jgi:O-antigen ligase
MVAKLLIVSLIVTVLLVFIEIVLGHPLLTGIASVSAYIRFHDPLAGRFRNGDYRVMAGFESALLLGAFLSAIMWIAASYMRRQRKTLLAVLIIGFCALDIYFTASRAAMLASVLGFSACVVLYGVRRLRQQQRVGSIFFIALLGLIFVAAGYYFILAPYLHSLQFATDQASSSTSQRLSQFVNVWNLLVHRPILGYGAMQTYSGNLSDLDSIDNYYLKSLLQAGLIGLFSTVMIRFSLLVTMTKRFMGGELQWWHLGFILSLLAFSLSDVFVSQNSNHPYLLGLSFLILIYARRSRHEDDVTALASESHEYVDGK